jgi:hypothetical protein
MLEVVNVEQQGVYATFAIIVLSSPERVRPGDLVLSAAKLPERRLRNQNDSALRQRRSTGAWWAGTDAVLEDRLPWRVDEPNPVVVIRACPRSFVPTTRIPLFKTENVQTRSGGNDEHDAIDIFHAASPTDTSSPLYHNTTTSSFSPFAQLSSGSAPMFVQSERLEVDSSLRYISDLLDERFVGGDGLTVFMSRIDVALMTNSIVPQKGRRVWRHVLMLPLVVERTTSGLVKMESRRQSLAPPPASEPYRPSPLTPTLPLAVRVPSAKQRPRRSTVVVDSKEPLPSQEKEIAAPLAPPAVGAMYWLPTGLQYVVNVE